MIGQGQASKIGRLCIHLMLWTALLCLSAPSASGKHLVGGALTYKYLGPGSFGKFRYEITVTMYRDCGQTTLFDQSIMIGIYENNGNPSDSVGNIIISTPLISKVDPPGVNSGCPPSSLPDICLERGIYKTVIELPASNVGYHLAHVRCCRNNLKNLKPNPNSGDGGSLDGQTYYAFIPPTNLQNTSAVFGIPAPYYCTDTFQYSFAATDADGDSLVYQLAWPFSGGTPFDPAPEPTKYLYIPPSLVSYNNGYSFNKPFGNSGFASIDPATGILEAYPPNQGNYALAIDVLEYRNGSLIGATRLDIQIIIIGCPDNKPTKIFPVDATFSGSMDLTVNENETLNVNIGFSDDDKGGGFSSFKVTGDVFDGAKTNPPAQFNVSQSGNSAYFNINWPTSCDQGRAAPYRFNITTTDRGCPPRSSLFAFNVHVIPFLPKKVSGQTRACTNEALTYTVPTSSGSKVEWIVEGGNVIEKNDNSITIQWYQTPTARLKYIETSKYGCPNPPVTVDVDVYEASYASEISGPPGVCLDSITQYSVTTSNNTTSHYWAVEGGNIVSVSPDSTAISIKWTEAGNGQIIFVGATKDGCPSDTSFLSIEIDRPILEDIYGSKSVCPNSRRIDYWIDSQANSTYVWEITGGVQHSGGNGGHIQVNWGEKGMGKIKVTEYTKHGCPSEPVEVSVIIDYVLHTPNIEGDNKVCEFTKDVEYTVIFSNGSTYDWSISGGTIISGNGTPKARVDWDVAGTGILTVQETAFDSVNMKWCLGSPVDLLVDIRPLPNTSPIQGEPSVCEDLWAAYYVQGYPNSTFIWSGDTGVDLEGQGDSSIRILFADSGSYHLVVAEITEDSCIGESKVLDVIVHPTPATTEIRGPINVCLPQDKHVTYSVKGFGASVYNWEVTGGYISAGTGENIVTVTWLEPGAHSITVQEISQFGCIGPEKLLDVRVDGLTLETELVTTVYENDADIKLSWKSHDADFLSGHFRIFRALAGQEFFFLVDSVPATQSYYIDKNVETGETSYKYYVQADNICAVPVSSLPHRSILLTGRTTGDTTLQIEWNPYTSWESGVSKYEVYRGVNEEKEFTPFSWTKVTEEDLVASLDGYKQCYRIAALKSNQEDLVSWSNIYCFEFPPIVYIPNVFTPGTYDELNNTFQVFVANYKAFDLKIYNRWGEQVFTSDDPDRQWDGTFRDRNSPDGVYLYMLNVTGLKNNVYRSGTLNLLRN